MSGKRDLPSEPCPWLLYKCGRHMKDHLFYSLFHPHTIHYKRIPSFTPHTEIVAHSRGWFLLSQKKDTHSSLSLWNSTISHHHNDSDKTPFIHLPPLLLKPKRKITNYFLSSPPDEDPDSMVLLFVETLPSLICIRPAHQHKQWVKFIYDRPFAEPAFDFRYDHLKGCVSCNEKLYSIKCYDQLLFTLHVDKHNHVRMEHLCPLPEIKPMTSVGNNIANWTMENLIECCGELLYVQIMYGYVKLKKMKNTMRHHVSQVDVFKLVFDKMVWERAHSLMGQAVFFNGLGESWCPALRKGIIKADSIYFTFPNNKDLYSFNVKDDCLSINSPSPNLPSSCCSPMILVPYHVRLCSREEKDDNTIVENQTQEATFSNTTAEIQTLEITFSDLPLGILMEISDCLNLFDYMSFRSVCRNCCFIVPKLKRKQALQRFKTCLSSASSSSIWLLLPTNDTTTLKFIDPIHGTSFIMNLPESLKGSVVRNSRNGWLLMCDKKSSLSFFNPFTEEIIKLQDTPTDVHAREYSMAFSSLPTSSDCIIVGCNASPPRDAISRLSVLVSTMGEDRQWLEEYLGDDRSIFWLSNKSPLFYKGSIYLLGIQGNLSTLDYEDVRDLVWDILSKPKRPCKNFREGFLIECDGKLMSIFVGQMGRWLKVFSLNFDTMRWEEVRSIGKYVIYVSPSTCISKEASIKGTENRIYFTRFRDKSMVFYSLETRKFHADGEGTVENFYNTKEPLVATWIEPTY